MIYGPGAMIHGPRLIGLKFKNYLSLALDAWRLLLGAWRLVLAACSLTLLM